MLYLDYAATTPVHEQVLKTYVELLETQYGNPDSNHPIGVEVNRLLHLSRSQIGSLLHIKPGEVLFTSGASESNNLAIKGVALQYQNRGKHIITSNAEHATIKNACQQLETLFGFDVTYLPVNESGVVSLEQVKSAVRNDTILVSLIYVNNELGSINPIAEIGSWLKQHTRIIFHSDLVQAVGKHELPTAALDLATISAHKIYGLKGSGLLVKKENILLQPLISGGDQEYGLRAGTSNTPVNIVFAKTLRLALEKRVENHTKVVALREVFFDAMKKRSDITYNSTAEASPFIINLQTPLGSEILMNALGRAGYCISAKSTCSTKTSQVSHVLLAIGLSQEAAQHSVRISISPDITTKEFTTFAQTLQDIIDRYRT